ncbi:hypothetical protein RchiOBHm_Chr6g0265711 [Rosa chinensis]|uniref:Uncharacterized protein n=1 Tax=Rosa chinensis TaxID=74649 RepID=A0A2P6PPG9_ROSCH|nr:hypothetical protein RchiOBHm_Chr6g0265711 [Rosa chinensis]
MPRCCHRHLHPVFCSRKLLRDDEEEPNTQKAFTFSLPFLCFLSKILVDGKVVNKACTLVSDKSVVKNMAEVPKYVSRT